MPARAAHPPITEAAFQRAVIALATRQGWKVAHFGDSRKQVRGGRLVGDRQTTGFPDLVCVRERTLFAELKGPKTRVTDQQIAWMAALIDAGEEVYLWRPNDWEDLERILGRSAMARGP